MICFNPSLLVTPTVVSQINFSEEGTITFRNVLCSFIIMMEALTVIIWLVEHKLYALSIRNEYIFLQSLPHRLLIETTSLPSMPAAVAVATGYATKQRGRIRFYYRQPGEWPWRWFGGSVKRVASYDGYIDSAGRPHGYGVWQDSAPRGEFAERLMFKFCEIVSLSNSHASPAGENLHGIWRHGLPCGPFQSSESETGHGFSNIHIAFVHNRVETWKVKHWKPERSFAGLHWGIAAVESCFAGGFFKHLPASELFFAPSTGEEGGSARSCVERLAQVATSSRIFVLDLAFPFCCDDASLSRAGTHPGCR